MDDLEKFKSRPYNFYTNSISRDEENNEELDYTHDTKSKHFMSNLKSLRIHDLVLKMVHSNLSNILEAEFNNFSRENYRYNNNFTRSEGLTEIVNRLHEMENKDNSKKEHIDIGVQLQGNQFRYFLSSSFNIKNINILLAKQL